MSRAQELSLTRPRTGVIVHEDGIIGLFLDDDGMMYAEVSGFQTEQGQRFIGALEQLADVGPDLYSALFHPDWGQPELSCKW